MNGACRCPNGGAVDETKGSLYVPESGLAREGHIECPLFAQLETRCFQFLLFRGQGMQAYCVSPSLLCRLCLLEAKESRPCEKT